METLKDFLWPIVLIGGLGAFIDFLIGKTGQARAKDFLLKWWVRFDDVHWKNFGKEEGLFAGRLIESGSVNDYGVFVVLWLLCWYYVSLSYWDFLDFTYHLKATSCGALLAIAGPSLGGLSAQPGDQLLHDLFVGRAERGFCGGRRLGLLLDVAQHVDQHLGRPQLGRGRFVDELERSAPRAW